MDRDAILNLCAELAGRALVVVDETYIEYAGVDSIAAALESHANLVVLRTLSKSHAAAGVRCGVAVARADVSELLAKVLAPYPIPQPVVQAVMAIMAPANQVKLAEKRQDIITRRDEFAAAARDTAPVREVLPTDANYLLMIVDDADALCARAGEAGVILRNQSHQPGLANAVRVSIGTEDEMDMMLAILRGEAVSAPGEDRIARHVRRTSETAISVEVNLDRKAPVRISTGVGFYDHMLDQIAKHAGFSLQLECDGDLHIDPHHTIEDCAIALGVAIRSALGDKRGVGRYGFCLPMDESLVTVALDLSGRYYLDFKGEFPADHVGDLPTDMIEHVFRSLAENLQANLHIAVEGENAHHMVEACFKGFARALRQAIRQDGAELPSTKGVL
jgi:histidinol-phosphate aminotransferase/imidazoleglycerol-phosphate dehydratase/histidinol-phosphatase